MKYTKTKILWALTKAMNEHGFVKNKGSIRLAFKKSMLFFLSPKGERGYEKLSYQGQRVVK